IVHDSSSLVAGGEGRLKYIPLTRNKVNGSESMLSSTLSLTPKSVWTDQRITRAIALPGFLSLVGAYY
ncbi:MAG TPA: hypothetical protein PL112_15115, partial [Candidatus Obscuribacter sp.]|nr:hypothetical protein [Candidatus Obscuribacter sp.]